jgi:hypothetical protein
VGLIGGIWGWVERWLAWLVDRLVEMFLVWLFKHYVLMGMDFQIWVWVVLALAVIPVVVLIAWLVDALR